MAHAIENKSLLHDNAPERLITKLIIDRTKVGDDWKQERAKLINTFLTKYGDFINKRGSFARDHTWITATEEDLKAYRWHQRYSLPVTKVLGKLACLTLSRILGIGSAEQNWKQVKAVKSGQRVNTTMTKTTKEVLMYTQYQHACAQAKMINQATAGKLWDDGDFTSIKMDLYCRDIQELLQVEPLPPRHVCLSKEQWETHTSGTNEDVKLKARLEKKYSGLHLYDKDYDSRLLTCAKIHFHKTRGNNRYCIFCSDGWIRP
jgi:hypothetical protein